MPPHQFAIGEEYQDLLQAHGSIRGTRQMLDGGRRLQNTVRYGHCDSLAILNLPSVSPGQRYMHNQTYTFTSFAASGSYT
jgi:hypothetical protein